ncbi:hypothetical protein MRB53_023890 [Persea americana]|uniref:Uncharacterized protein n=1 Tax=Persea americana TaxID=3435 RepID=A0ACC2LAK9_PERAE|nr:hypothetical protein MRB53_023890 [Persea americana]
MLSFVDMIWSCTEERNSRVIDNKQMSVKREPKPRVLGTACWISYSWLNRV